MLPAVPGVKLTHTLVYSMLPLLLSPQTSHVTAAAAPLAGQQTGLSHTAAQAGHPAGVKGTVLHEQPTAYSLMCMPLVHASISREAGSAIKLMCRESK